MEPSEVHDDAQSLPIPPDLVVDDRNAPVAAAIPTGGALPVEPRWGFCATVGFSLVVAAAFLAIQTAVVIGWVIVRIASTGKMPDQADAELLSSNGLFLAIATLISMPACLGLVVLLAKLKRGASIAGYLGLRAVPPRVALAWLGCLLAFAVATDSLAGVHGKRLPDGRCVAAVVDCASGHAALIRRIVHARFHARRISPHATRRHGSGRHHVGRVGERSPAVRPLRDRGDLRGRPAAGGRKASHRIDLRSDGYALLAEPDRHRRGGGLCRPECVKLGQPDAFGHVRVCITPMRG